MPQRPFPQEHRLPGRPRGHAPGKRPVRSAQMVLMNEELRAELLRRVAADQDARHALDLKAMAAADGENLPWLRQVITGVGWPGKSLVGEDGAQAIARDGRSSRGNCVTRTTSTGGGPASGSVPWPTTSPEWPSTTHPSRCGYRVRPAGRLSRPGHRTRARPAPRPARRAARRSPFVRRAKQLTPVRERGEMVSA
jgi:hypothetical protein